MAIAVAIGVGLGLVGKMLTMLHDDKPAAPPAPPLTGLVAELQPAPEVLAKHHREVAAYNRTHFPRLITVRPGPKAKAVPVETQEVVALFEGTILDLVLTKPVFRNAASKLDMSGKRLIAVMDVVHKMYLPAELLTDIHEKYTIYVDAGTQVRALGRKEGAACHPRHRANRTV
jgi:hypothetical protein